MTIISLKTKPGTHVHTLDVEGATFLGWDESDGAARVLWDGYEDEDTTFRGLWVCPIECVHCVECGSRVNGAVGPLDPDEGDPICRDCGLDSLDSACNYQDGPCGDR